MLRNIRTVLVASLILATPLVAQDRISGRDVPPVLTDAGGCPDEPCGCNGPQPIDTSAYFVPTFSGWQTAKRVWSQKAGGSNYTRFFSYATNHFELIKCPDGSCTETFEVTPTWIYVTSEMGAAVLDSQPRIFLGNGLKFIPRVFCSNKPTFTPCHQGEQFINGTSCLASGSTPPHCSIYNSTLTRTTYNYGGTIGSLDSLVKTDRLDDGSYEKYWYGYGRGLLRWEHRTSSNQILDWIQESGIIPNSPISHNSCVQPQ